MTLPNRIPPPPPKSMLLVLDNKDYIMSCPLVTIYVITTTSNCHTNIAFRGGYHFFQKFIDSQYILLMIVGFKEITSLINTKRSKNAW